MSHDGRSEKASSRVGSRSKMAVVMVFVRRFSLFCLVTRFAFCLPTQKRLNFVTTVSVVPGRRDAHFDGGCTRLDRAQSII